MWSDNDTAVDALNVQHLVRAVLDVVRDSALTPVTVGVFGPWGSGKSSVARMVRLALEAEEADNRGVVVVYFNGWRFEGYEDAKAALTAAILEALERRVKLVPGLWDQTKDAFADMWGRVNWLRVGKLALEGGLAVKTGGLSLLLTRGRSLAGLGEGGGGGGGDGEKGDLEELLGGILRERADEERALHATVRDFDTAFKSLLEKTDVQRLVVVIDDLDRCLPDRVIDTLEAIRLFLSVERTAFVISADEALIQHAVSQRFPAMEQLRLNVGRDYLQKMIQVPVRVPPLSPEDVEQYVALLFAQRNLSGDTFERLCTTVRTAMHDAAAQDADAFGRATFTATTAARHLGADPVNALREDLALGAQIAPVLALSAQGNPRLVKRFLNALMLRLGMATARGTTLRREVAAKLMLAEYFAPELFDGIAASQASQGGYSSELQRLEVELRAEQQTLDEGVSPAAAQPGTVESGPTADHEHARGSARTRSARAEPRDAATSEGSGRRPGRGVRGSATSRTESPGDDAVATSTGNSAASGDAAASAYEPALPPWAVAARTDPWLRLWLASEPALGGVDLRPYVYFARERILPLPAATARMSPAGLETLRAFLAGGVAAHRAGATRARELPRPDVFAVFADLADRVRRSSEPYTEDSLLYAMYRLTEARPELLPELASVLPALSVAQLEPRSASQLITLAQTLEAAGVTAVPTVQRVLERWQQQNDNPLLREAAARALPRLVAIRRGPQASGAAR